MSAGALFDLNSGDVAVDIDGIGRLTYRELADRVDSLAERIPARSVVFILNRNDADSLVGTLACLNHGAVPLLLDAKTDPNRLSALKSAYLPDFVYGLSDAGFALEDLRSAATDRNRAMPHPDLGMLLATSGSTGAPKLVRVSRGNVLANARSHVEYLALRRDDSFVASLPLDHTYGLSMALAHLAAGARIVLTQKTIVERSFWELFTEKGVSVFGGVPYTYEMLDRLAFYRRNLPTLRLMTLAGGKLREELHRKFAEHAARNGLDFVNMYGQSEATAAMAYLPPEFAVRGVGTIGKAIPGGRLTLAADGELVYEGPSVTMGYAHSRADLALGDVRGGILATGDVAEVDANGLFRIVGRKSRFLKLQGHRVGLDDAELMLKDAFPDFDFACTGNDDAMNIFVALVPEGMPCQQTVTDVRRHVSARTRLSESLFAVRPVNRIPKNANGKTLYSELP